MDARAALAATAMAALTAGSMLAMGREAVAQPCRTRLDSLGGYQRIHAWCSGRCVKVQVQCRKGALHTSSDFRWGYNKAECHVGRDGGIVARDVDTCRKPAGGNLCCA